MSSAAPSAPVARSSSHRSPNLAPDSPSRPSRSQSTRVPGSSSSSGSGAPRSHPSQRPSTSTAREAMANVAARDYEQTNVAQAQPPSTSSGRPRELDRSQYPARTDSMRASEHVARTQSRGGSSATSGAPSSGNGHDRFASMDAAARTQPPTNGMVNDNSMRHQPSQGRRRTTLDTQTGKWGLGKTIGAGSMGKVKLARNLETGEQVAIKIVPRMSTDEHRSQADRERAEHSKEIRTAREAAIVSLVQHPYICGMRDVVRTAHHWYMLFEYVNGGQMLDYIISHGRLKEKQARKFARQICSALDYCHRNSIVHRDLKIENILISKTGDIKIIDFGLSNLFAPHSTLKTFCGSLYFAAPELLQAKQYTGPEVDVWSFGIVLYVLVCGKVPFDDQSMPQLHAKIKKGYVEYPPWLSSECKNLISRMLVTDPKSRASLTEIANHPWLTKGFSGPAENFLPHREPLQLPLDQDVVRKMTGFDFGTTDYINTHLTKILTSEDYQRTVRNMEKRGPPPVVQQTPEVEKKRGVFDFYKRRGSASRDTLTNLSQEAVQYGEDPVNAYAPMISIYYLVREKMERERREANPGALEVPGSMSSGEKPLKLPDLPEPPKAFTNYHTHESAGEAPSGGRTRPRARTHGEEEVADNLQKMHLQTSQNDGTTPAIVAPPQEASTKKESTAAGLLRRFSTRRKQNAPGQEAGVEREKHQPTLNVIHSPTDATPRKSFSVRRTRTNEGREAGAGAGKENSSASLHVQGSTKVQPELLTPPAQGNEGGSGSGFPKRFMSLRRSTSVDRRRLGKRGASDGQNSMEPPPGTSGSDHSSYHSKKGAGAGVPASPGGNVGNDGTLSPASAESEARPSTSRAKSLGHARKESIQARRMKRAQANQQDHLNVPEETEADLAKESVSAGDTDQERDGPSTVQPVMLKGLFSVSTTSSKPLAVIQRDLVRVMNAKNLEYEEIKGGFLCTHWPAWERGTGKHNVHDENLSPGLAPPTRDGEKSGHRRKISFNALKGNSTDRDREEFLKAHPPNSATSNPRSPRSPNATEALDFETRPDGGAEDPNTDNSDFDAPTPGGPNPNRIRLQKNLPATPTSGGPSAYGRARNPGETSTHVRDDVGENTPLKFEIFIVKIPIIGLHGIQFKKVEGNMMHYKNMAQAILGGLKL